MTADPDKAGSGTLSAWLVHLLTASGAVFALLALEAVGRDEWRLALAWLLVALAVDGIDGTLARAFHVKTRLPRIDGAVLDLVIDYLSYVFVPALFIWRAGPASRARGGAARGGNPRFRALRLRAHRHEDRRRLFPRLSGFVERRRALSLRRRPRARWPTPLIVAALVGGELRSDPLRPSLPGPRLWPLAARAGPALGGVERGDAVAGLERGDPRRPLLGFGRCQGCC